MADIAQIWAQALPDVKNGVTGVGVWTALNTATPIIYENGYFVLGLPHAESELGGHLRIALTKRLIETKVSSLLQAPVALRVIEGTQLSDWEIEKRRDVEKQRLNAQSLAKMRVELQSKVSWDAVFEQLSRKYAAVPNKSLPQNRARFFEEAVSMLAEARQGQANWDEAGERNFARCLERLAQYADVPSTIVASHVLQKAGELVSDA